MTNKLPEVGQSYRRKIDNYILRCLEIYLSNDPDFDDVFIKMGGKDCDTGHYHIHDEICVDKFWGIFEELPKKSSTDTINEIEKTIERTRELVEERESAIKENYNCGLGDEVEKAKEELREEIKFFTQYTNGSSTNFTRLAQNLIDALDNCNIPEKKDCGITNYTIEEKPQSIWKDDPDIKDHKFLVKLKNGKVRMYDGMPEESTLGDFRQYCTLTDFINHIKSIEERLRKLEEKDK